jgi:hypothetical protein
VATAPRIGFIGLGVMGRCMARNPLDKGFTRTAMAHRRREALENLVADGAREAAPARELAEASGMAILCVTGAPQVEAIVHGEMGLLAGCLMEAPAKLNRVEIIERRVPLRA